MDNHDAEMRKWADAHAELSRQLAAANAKLQEAARLAEDSAKQADKMAGMGEAFERASEAWKILQRPCFVVRSGDGMDEW